MKSTGLGCPVGNIIAGAFEYADDIILPAPLCNHWTICTKCANSFFRIMTLHLVHKNVSQYFLVKIIKGLLIDDDFVEKNVGHLIWPPMIDKDIIRRCNELSMNAIHIMF